MNKKRKIGVFGGTFDPVHEGHLSVARGVLDRYRLDEFFFIPAPYPPHKQQPGTGFSHRVAMLEAALADEPHMSISLVEAERRSPSYTVDTLEELRVRMGNHHFYLVIGADSFVELHLWHRFEDLGRLADIVVAARPGIDREVVSAQVAAFAGEFRYDPAQEKWSRDDGFHIYLYSDIHVDLSSSEIRRRLARGEDVGGLLPPAVTEYIHRNKLYRSL